jgi:hypothetical protein
VTRALRDRAVAIAAACASALVIVAGGAWPSLAHADSLEGTPIDDVAARFSAPETGGPEHPRFVTTRVLAFETRLEALEEGEPLAAGTAPGMYPERLARTALERHIAEEILASLITARAMDPLGFRRQVKTQRVALVESIGGQAALEAAMHAEGISEDELADLIARRVRASTYVDRAITRILHPSDDELRTAYRTGTHPFRKQKFEDVRDALERWLVDQRLRAEEQSFFQQARARVQVSYP